MPDIWQQFHGLPKAIRDGVSNAKTIAVIDELEARYPKADLANLIMRVVVHEFPVAELPTKLKEECDLDVATATAIDARLRQDVFVGVIGDYLGLVKPTPPPAPKPPVVTPAPPSVPPTPTAPKNLPIVSIPPTPKPVVAPTVPVVKTLPPTPVPPPKPVVPAVPPTMPTVATPIKPPPVPTLAPTSPVGMIAPTTQYSDEDAAEIERQASRLRTMSAVAPNQDFDTVAKNILVEQNVAYGDELMERRAVAIVKARLKGIRQTPETKEMLIHDPKVGGLGLDPEIAQSVANAAERAAETMKSRGMVRPLEPIPEPPRPVVPQVNQARPAPMPVLRRDDAPRPEPVIPPNITDAPRPSRPIVRPADIPTPPPMPTPKPSPRVKAAVPVVPMMQGARTADRPTVADVVRPMTKTYGPAEEMRSMTLIEFRRLGQGAGDAAKRLLDKFQHLQRESFTVWSEAVNGWRQSDVYQLYLSMGRASLELGQPISQVIAELARTGKPYLSEHEFTVLADLNRQLQL